MKKFCASCLIAAFLALSSTCLQAGGSGLNVAIIVNQASSNSVQLGNYYREQRNVPPQNLLRINWTGANTEWTYTDFTNTLLNPFLAMLSARQLTNQIDYVVLSMDIPYRVNGGASGENSTTSSLFYGFWPDPNPPCSLAVGSSNLYAASEGIFRATPPINAASNSFLVTMITDTNLAFAKQIVDQGVHGDSTFPTNTVMLAKSTDTARNSRYPEFDNTVFNTRLRGNYSVIRTNTSTPFYFHGILGYLNGTSSFSILPNTFVPGALADNLTSYAGQLFENSGQTPLWYFTEAGAAGSYGTVTEPCTYPQKFPDPQAYFYQARGFALAECYYQSVTNPYQGLTVGEPLSAPFAQPATGNWIGLASNSPVSGITNLSLQFVASDTLHPIGQVDLFVDGLWLETITNVPPTLNNVLNVTVNGQLKAYFVPANATIKSVTSAMTASLNSSAYTNAVKTQFSAHGDRIELHSTDATKTGAQISVSVTSSNLSGGLTTFIHASSANFLDSIAAGVKTYVISGTASPGSVLQVAVTKTNGSVVNIALTNTAAANLVQFTQNFLNLVNANSSLNGPDGIVGQDLVSSPDGTIVEFNIYSTGLGYASAQIQTVLTSSLTVSSNPGTTLTDNLPDLQPRNHLYITAGATNFSVTFPLDTTTLSDGYHELAAVAYEGSHVRTQTRATQYIRAQNTPLSATFNILVGGSNTALEATMQFAVTANTNTIAKIELFSTGGSLGAVSNQSATVFSVPATNLDLGLHPFYAIVTDNSGHHYRTQTQYIRLVGMDSPFPIQIGVPPPVLAWTATAGRSYDILSATNVTNTFQVRATIIPTNTLAEWNETNASPAQQYYRVRVTPQ